MASGSGVRRDAGWLQANCVFINGEWLTPGAARERGLLPVKCAPAAQSPVPEAKTTPAVAQVGSSPNISDPLSKLNGLERSFWAYILKHPERFGDPKFHDVTFRIGNDCRYTPDFSAWMELGNGPEFCLLETKGPFAREDSIIKLKVAARVFAPWKFFLVTRPKGSHDFQVDQVKP